MERQEATAGSASTNKLLVVGVSTGDSNFLRRRALRKSWFRYKTSSDGPLTQQQKDSVHICFAGSKEGATLAKEHEEHGDIVLLDAPEGYHNLWRKVLTFFQWAEEHLEYNFMMHCDDDSFLRLDLLLPIVESSPQEGFYWGYIWNSGQGRSTAPIRDPRYKSHMPIEQYALDFYPLFASGCGFILSRDLVKALLAQPLPDYRLLDPPFGIHLCGSDRCILDQPIKPVHHACVRPYRPLPLFRRDTIVQHYMQPEEMRPYYTQALEALKEPTMPGQGAKKDNVDLARPSTSAASDCLSSNAGPTNNGGPAHELYDTLVQLGIWRR